MFSFFNQKEIQKDAFQLKTLTDLAWEKYSNLLKGDLLKALEKDFGKGNFSDNHCSVEFRFSEFEEFLFSFDIPDYEGGKTSLAVIGGRKYYGFMLQISKKDNYYCSVSDGLRFNAMGQAKLLRKTMVKKYNVRDTDAVISDLEKMFRG